MFLTPADFSGKFELHKGMYDVNKLTAYIERYEKRYLIELLGADYYHQFISDLDQYFVPRSPNFRKIYFPFEIEQNLYRILISEGMLDMLKGFIYFEYAKDLINQMTPFGNVMQQSENSKQVSTLYSMMYTRYNESVTTFSAIRDYIILNRLFPLGQAVSGLITNPGEQYFTAQNVPTQNYIVNYVNGVNTFTITNGGSGYSTAKGITASGGSGSGCLLSVIADPLGVIQSITIEDAGSGYTVGDLLTIDAGNFDAQISVDSLTTENVPIANGSGLVVDIEAAGIDGVGSFDLTNPGTGYTQMNEVQTAGGSGFGCVLSLQADENGLITSVIVSKTGDSQSFREITMPQSKY